LDARALALGAGAVLVDATRELIVKAWWMLEQTLVEWGIDPRAHQKKEIDKKDGDEDEASDKDMRFEAHHGFVARQVRGWDMFVLVVTFVGVFGHAHKLTSQIRGCDG
jgi:hypothetical protein